MAHSSEAARKLITKILNKSGQKGTSRVAFRTQLEAYTLADIKVVWAKVKEKSATQAPATTKPAARSETKRRSTVKISASAAKRRDRLQRAIASGKIKAKSGKKKATQMADKNPRDRVLAFNKLYKGVTWSAKAAKPKAKPKKVAKPSISKVYASIKGTSKRPYYLSKGYSVKSFTVGGGARGPGIIRSIPKNDAKSFNSLTKKQQAAVVKFLNSAAGKTLRSKGAPQKVNITAMRKIAKAKVAKAKAK